MSAEVVVNVPNLTSTFHYSIPAELRERLAAGHLVTVPFGGRRAQGVVAGLSEAAPIAEVKAIEGLVDPEPALTRAQLDLAYWIAHTYLAPLIECLTLMLPPGLSKRADTLYSLLDPNAEATHPAQQSVLRLLKSRGPLRGRQLDRTLPRANWRSAAESLTRRGLLARQSVLDPPSVHPKHVRTARLAAPLAQVEAVKPYLSKSPTKAARLAAVLDFLADEFDPVDVSWVYAETGASLQDLKDLAEMELVDLGEAEVWRDSLAGQEFVPGEPPTLTADQQKVWEAIRQRITRMERIENDSSVQSVDQTILLHGVTGSG